LFVFAVLTVCCFAISIFSWWVLPITDAVSVLVISMNLFSECIVHLRMIA